MPGRLIPGFLGGMVSMLAEIIIFGFKGAGSTATTMMLLLL